MGDSLTTKERLRIYDELMDWIAKGTDSAILYYEFVKKRNLRKSSYYAWKNGSSKPYGRQGEVLVNSSLYYLIGALLGDGCLYHHKETHNTFFLVGDELFCEKARWHFLSCTHRPIQVYPMRSKNVYVVRTNNYELALLFDLFRSDNDALINFLKDGVLNDRILFLEGFFDAEGCVQIINDKARKIPKICLDICNTRKEWLYCCQMVCDEIGIRTTYSNQEAYLSKDGYPRKKIYHLRVYDKASVSLFFVLCKTIKLKKEKEKLLEQWLLHKYPNSFG